MSNEIMLNEEVANEAENVVPISSERLLEMARDLAAALITDDKLYALRWFYDNFSKEENESLCLPEEMLSYMYGEKVEANYEHVTWLTEYLWDNDVVFTIRRGTTEDSGKFFDSESLRNQVIRAKRLYPSFDFVTDSGVVIYRKDEQEEWLRRPVKEVQSDWDAESDFELSPEHPDSPEWKDGTELACGDCPPSDCTGHCASCVYRPF